MLLSMSTGSSLTDKQINYIMEWIKQHFSSPKEVHQLAHIAWQYDLIELRDELLKLHKSLLNDN